MNKAQSLRGKQNVFSRLISLTRSYRQQIAVVAVAATLGLALVLNVVMAPENISDKAQSQMAHLKKEPSENVKMIR